MAPGGGVCKEVVESHPKYVKYDVVVAKAEKNNTSIKNAVGLAEKHRMPSTNGVHELLECPVCTSLMYPPIYQCPNGHTLCSDCKIRVHNCCPTCCLELGNIRCLALEKVAESLELPCRYQSLGCHDIFPYYSKLKHEQHCRFRPYNCPYAGSECSITGDIPALVTHLKDDHNVDMHDGCTFNHRYVKANPHEVENATWMLTNLTKWGGALLELSQFGGINESKKMIGDVVSKLEEALVINPSNHEALWCLGNAYLSHAFLTPDINVAQIDFEKASDSFQRAVDENPGNDLYLKSLEAASEAPELHTELHKHGFAQQAVVGGPSATSSAKNSNGIVLPNKASLYLTTIEDVAEYKEDKIDCELVENNGWKSKI